MDNAVSIIVHVSQGFSDVSDVFFELLKKHWPDCGYRIIISSDNEYCKKYGHLYEVFPGLSLTERVSAVAEKYESEFYLSLLADAFITGEPDNAYVETFVRMMRQDGLRYCNIFPLVKKRGELFRPASCRKLYDVAFLAFIASRDFLVRDINQFENDFEFENHYLRLSRGNESAFEHMSVAGDNFLGIKHGVIKGRWVRSVYKYLLKEGLLTETSQRARISIKDSLLIRLKVMSQILLEKEQRSKLKRITRALGYSDLCDT